MTRESTSSSTYSEITDRSVKRRKSYIDHPKDIFILTCLIHRPQHSSDKCKVLGDFSSKYSKTRPTKDRRHEPEF